MIDPVNAAKAIKQELKTLFPNARIKAVSKRFAGGNSVDAYVSRDVNLDEPSIKELVRKLEEKYEYSCFDGYNDSVSYKHDSELPQAKFVNVGYFSW